MARIKLGALAQDVRGSLNGTTFSRNRGGAYVRTKVSPVQPVSAFSANSRQSFKIMSTTWATLLTAGERGAWIAFALTHPFINVFGDSLIVSGIAMFQGLNKRLQQLGFATFADPPASISVDPPGATTVVASVGPGPSMSIVFTPMVPPSAGSITAYVWATPPMPPGRVPTQKDYRLLNDFTGTVRDETYDWGPAYLTRFLGVAPVGGNIIHFRYGYLDSNDGAISVMSDVDFTVVTIPGPLINLSTSEQTGTVATVTTAGPHGLSPTGQIEITGATNVTALNTIFASPNYTIVDASTFQCVLGSATHALALETGTVQQIA